jgi:putative addiction module antidote
MAQKILKVGSSLAVTIPKKSSGDLGFKAGDIVNVRVDDKNKRLIIERGTERHEKTVEWIEGFIKKYNTALKALADK